MAVFPSSQVSPDSVLPLPHTGLAPEDGGAAEDEPIPEEGFPAEDAGRELEPAMVVEEARLVAPDPALLLLPREEEAPDPWEPAALDPEDDVDEDVDDDEEDAGSPLDEPPPEDPEHAAVQKTKAATPAKPATPRMPATPGGNIRGGP